MNEVTIFNSPQFGQIRTLTIDGEPWFVGKDVAIALGYAKSENAVGTHVDSEDKTTTLIQGTGSNYKSNAVIINESGLYSLIMSSKLPEAKKFKRWVMSEVLPAIRKTGGYFSGNIEEIITKTVTATATAVVTEVMKQIIPLIQSVNNSKTVPEAPKQTIKAVQHATPGSINTPGQIFGVIRKKYVQPTQSKILQLPEEIRRQVDNMIMSGNFSTRQITDYITNATGKSISNVTVWHYKTSHFIGPESGSEEISYEQITMK